MPDGRNDDSADTRPTSGKKPLICHTRENLPENSVALFCENIKKVRNIKAAFGRPFLRNVWKPTCNAFQAAGGIAIAACVAGVLPPPAAAEK
ncbi:hypothetical protein [Mixta gaviniae]|uniref:Uncharacterized protein n=1 Tax=Mixta gaviniae TaxID=665914 RepID=A0A1X1DKC7_9GAMM|nr:hypothetical protein [Mixta gaviniae]AUX93177.1 hypothetical protein C2E15_08870 [Mixta gaviniae]ORM77133.1 hypothetical protein HA44_14545 [Mixta gaviniae]